MKGKKGTEFIDRAMNFSIDNIEHCLKSPSKILKNLDQPTLIRLKKLYVKISTVGSDDVSMVNMYIKTRNKQSSTKSKS